jgi:cytochrome P450
MSTIEAPISMADPAVVGCPFAAYDALRESAPVHLDPKTGMYVVTLYEDIKAICADTATYSNDTRQLTNRETPAKAEIERLLAEADFLPVPTLITNDPPAHRPYRTLVDKAFNPRRVKAIETRIAEIADTLIDDFPAGPFDFVQAFAIPMPIRMIAEQLGVPTDMAETFKRWSDATLEQADFGITPERQVAAMKAQIEMFHFFWDKAQDLRAQPTDLLFSDIANAQIDGRPIDRHELTSILTQLLVAGNETTTNSLAACAHRLATDQPLQDRLRAEPAGVHTFVEEMLRLEAPIQGLFRRATRPATLRGIDVPEGAILNLRWGSGNRDPRQFDRPAEIDLARGNAATHLTFGLGIHYCIGNQLGRAELRRSVKRLLARTRAIRLDPAEGASERIVHFFAYGFRRLGLVVEPA